MLLANHTLTSANDVIRLATLDDLKYIDALRKKEGNALGFIPIQRYEMEVTGERQGRIFLYTENDDPVGFIYSTFGGGTAKIQQIAIQNDARRMERASALVERISHHALKERNCHSISLRCANDLESVKFWNALQFDAVGETTSLWIGGAGERAPSKSQRRLTLFHKIIGGLFKNHDTLR